jgi:uncharacterized protein (DUF952 family)
VATIYKLCSTALWREAEQAGVFTGSSIDRADGYIHFSTAAQVAETAALYFRGEADLMLVAVDGTRLGPELRYEASRGGALFPHLYAALPLTAVVWARPLPVGADGLHRFPDLPA